MVIIIMGVSGCGKSTVGRLLAQELGWPFYEGDGYHPRENIEKMSTHLPLTDGDRRPWLAALARLIRDLSGSGHPAVVACSALKQTYRDMLAGNSGDVRFVYLKAEYDLIRQRLLSRQGHFMKADLLQTQFEALEEPVEAVIVDAAADPAGITGRIRRALAL